MEFGVFICISKNTWNVKILLQLQKPVSVQFCISYLNNFLRERALQLLQMFPVTDQQVKHVTCNLSHCLVPKLQKKGEYYAQSDEENDLT